MADANCKQVILDAGQPHQSSRPKRFPRWLSLGVRDAFRDAFWFSGASTTRRWLPAGPTCCRWAVRLSVLVVRVHAMGVLLLGECWVRGSCQQLEASAPAAVYERDWCRKDTSTVFRRIHCEGDPVQARHVGDDPSWAKGMRSRVSFASSHGAAIHQEQQPAPTLHDRPPPSCLVGA